MHFTDTSILFLLSILSASTSAQGLTQNQTCANACTAAQACDHQCVPGTSYDIQADTNAYADCLCQSGCLCNAEICLQCCDAAGVNGAGPDTCGFIQLAAGNVLAYCSVVSRPFFLPSYAQQWADPFAFSYMLDWSLCAICMLTSLRSKGRGHTGTRNACKGLFRLR